jgi:hypothetical protein
MRRGTQASLFAVILLIYGIAGILYATLTPPWQAPDEPAHYNYIRHLATQGSFPELVAGCYDQAYLDELTSRQFPPELSIEAVCYEFHQPPLYYLLATPIFLLSGGSLTVLRLLSVAWGAGVIIFAYLIGRTIFPHRPILALGAMAFVAFVPMHLAILASINNDGLAEFILSILLFFLILRLSQQNSSSLKGNLLLGLLLGAALITKATIYIAIPLVAVALWLAHHSGVRIEIRASETSPEPTPPPARTLSSWLPLLKQLALIYSLALLIALPWYLRNATLYGSLDILGLHRHDAIVTGQPRTVDYLARTGLSTYLADLTTTTFRSFWGQFGWMAVPMDSRTYFFLTLLTATALTGLLSFILRQPLTWQECGMNSASAASQECGMNSALNLLACRLQSAQRAALALLALTILLVLLAYTGYNLTFVQFQGRYLFPSLIPLGLFFTLGLVEALSSHRAYWLTGLLTLALAWLLLTAVQTGQFDKWALLLTGLALFLAAARPWLTRHHRSLPTPWLLAACYTALALLALAAPFWFILPYL